MKGDFMGSVQEVTLPFDFGKISTAHRLASLTSSKLIILKCGKC
jgi:hypothetical protein